MSSFPIVLGGGALAAYLLSRHGDMSRAAKRDALTRVPGPFVWPIAAWKGRSPVISDGFGSRRPGGRHEGVDMMFKREPNDPFPPGSPNGSKLFVMPDNVAALAVSDGVVWFAKHTSYGFTVVIDHGGTLS